MKLLCLLLSLGEAHADFIALTPCVCSQVHLGTLRLSQSLRTRRNTSGVLPTPWSRGSAPTLETNPIEPLLCLLIRNSTPALMTPKMPHKYPSLQHASRANCVLEWGEPGNRSLVSVLSDLTWCYGFVIYQKSLSTFTLNSSSVFSGV